MSEEANSNLSSFKCPFKCDESGTLDVHGACCKVMPSIGEGYTYCINADTCVIGRVIREDRERIAELEKQLSNNEYLNRNKIVVNG